jgi:hypothetical protein
MDLATVIVQQIGKLARLQRTMAQLLYDLDSAS